MYASTPTQINESGFVGADAHISPHQKKSSFIACANVTVQKKYYILLFSAVMV